ncbi:class I SAM-dependent DNA methyltransferase [Methanoculleus sp.]|uniref:HsdM family class I SAM-dependent methyltransferase n=1 Tax=Methanoculleus sp. TaxID=90427 RepID=UPI0025F73D77|nr:N-6 DNA methylase [Methanoculleus sp.]
MRMDPERTISNYTRKVLTTLKSYDIPETEAALYGLYFLSVQQSDYYHWMGLRRAEDARDPDTVWILRETIEGLALPAECVVRKELPDEAVWKLTVLFDEISRKADDIRMGVSDRLAEAAHKGYSMPLSVVDLVVELAAPSTGTTVYDPACRTGSLLVRCARHVARNATEPDIRLYGAALGGEDYCITRLNLKANNLENAGIRKILEPVYPGSDLRVAGGGQPDLVLLDLVEDPGDARSKDGGYPLDELRFFLAPGSLLALLIPGKVLGGGDYMRFREWLVGSDTLEAIIRLPNGLFPTVRVDVDLLLVRPGEPAEAKGRVLFVDASALPVDRVRKALAGGLAGKVVDLYSAFHRKGEVAGPGAPGLHHRIVSTEEIEWVESGSDRDYNLDVSRYVLPEPEPVDLGAEFERLVGYERRRAVLGREMEEQLERVLVKLREEGLLE